MTYAHRNGESGPPTVAGWYWFSGMVLQDGYVVYGDVWEQILYCINPAYNIDPPVIAVAGEHLKLDGFQGRWWGPIVPPWEE